MQTAVISLWNWAALALGAVLLGGILWFVRFCRLHAAWTKFTQARLTAPFRIHLVAANATTTDSQPRVVTLANSLLEIGFEEAGTFQISEMPGATVRGFTSASTAVLACIFQLKDRQWLDLISCYEDNSSITYSTIQTGEDLPRPPTHPVLRFPELTPAALHHRLVQDRPRGKLKNVSCEGFASLLQESYAASQDWLAERGGYTVDELRKLVPAAANLSAESLRTLRDKVIRESLINWWRTQPDMPFPAENFNECAPIIHDELSIDQMLFAFSLATDDWDVSPKHIPRGARSPRAAFEALNELRNGGLIKVFEKTTPLRADFYWVNPSEDEDKPVAISTARN